MPDKNPDILSPNELKYLRSMCRYLGSMGMTNGIVYIDIDNYGDFDLDAFIKSIDNTSHFDNNFRAEIPEGLKEIFKKVLIHIAKEGIYSEPDVDELNYERIEIEIDCEEKSLVADSFYSYFSKDDGMSQAWEDTEEVNEVFKSIQDDPELAGQSVLELRYHGSGDSGYIEDYFVDNFAVPAYVIDWAYNVLENCCGGWEINEGSDGLFRFDTINNSVYHYHSNNYEENEQRTLFEIKFGLV